MCFNQSINQFQFFSGARVNNQRIFCTRLVYQVWYSDIEKFSVCVQFNFNFLIKQFSIQENLAKIECEIQVLHHKINRFSLFRITKSGKVFSILIPEVVRLNNINQNRFEFESSSDNCHLRFQSSSFTFTINCNSRFQNNNQFKLYCIV